MKPVPFSLEKQACRETPERTVRFGLDSLKTVLDQPVPLEFGIQIVSIRVMKEVLLDA